MLKKLREKQLYWTGKILPCTISSGIPCYLLPSVTGWRTPLRVALANVYKPGLEETYSFSLICHQLFPNHNVAYHPVSSESHLHMCSEGEGGLKPANSHCYR